MSKKKSTNLFVIEDAETYHSKTDFISSSILAEMLKSPLHFYHAWTTPCETSDAMDKGTFIHKVLLEQDIAKFCPRPLNDKGDLVRSNSKEYEAFLAANEGKTPIHPDLYNETADVLESACEHAEFMRLYNESRVEQSFYGTHKATGLPIKARTDLITNDLSTIIDAKSTANIFRFDRQLFDLGYDIRLAHYAKVVEAATGKLPKNLMFFAIESSAPYASRLFKLSDVATEQAFQTWESLMNEIRVCKAEDRWPGLGQDVREVSRPVYLNREAESVSFDEVI